MSSAVRIVVRIFLSLIQAWRRWRLKISDPTVQVGRNVVIKRMKGSHIIIGSHVVLGDYVRLHGNVQIDAYSQIRPFTLLDARHGMIRIGQHCSLNDYCVLYGMGDITIGSDVRIATHTIIVAGNHNFDNPDQLIRLQGVKDLPCVIQDDVWIGANVTILGGTTIGTGSVIGAGAVVTKDIPPRAIAVGSPAKVIKSR
jgi:acetyltransferase-like isoleucine patch superfamily enzyme